MAFQLVEALFALTIIASLLSLGVLPISPPKTSERRDVERIQELLILEQREAFFTQKRIRINLQEHQMVIQKNGNTYTLSLTKVCTHNFADQIEITEKGRWERAGSIFCGQERVVIGIGQSIPRIR